MKKTKTYDHVRFSPKTLRDAKKLFHEVIQSDEEREFEPIATDRDVKIGDERWSHNNDEEFFADYRRGTSFKFSAYFSIGSIVFKSAYGGGTTVSVSARNREKIETVFEYLESQVSESQIEIISEDQPVIFIGHGQNPIWRDLKDHLQDKHGYQLESYEVGARSGHSIRDILEYVLEESTIAFLVLTGEDETADGFMHARQNVIHETGLFQGRLGFNKAIVLLEYGTEEFSNIQGIQQIRFSKGNISETFGDVLATIKREFNL